MEEPGECKQSKDAREGEVAGVYDRFWSVISSSEHYQSKAPCFDFMFLFYEFVMCLSVHKRSILGSIDAVCRERSGRSLTD